MTGAWMNQEVTDDSLKLMFSNHEELGLTIVDTKVDIIKYSKITYDRMKELLKRTIEVCGDKENSKYSSHYDDFIEELMERIEMTEEEYNELFKEEE